MLINFLVTMCLTPGYGVTQFLTLYEIKVKCLDGFRTAVF